MEKYLHHSTGLQEKNKFQWEQEHQDAFEKLKSALYSALVLTIPTKTDRFILDTDVSEFTIRDELLQVHNVEEDAYRIIVFL